MSEIDNNLPKKTAYKLVGKLQNYKWGGTEFIKSLVGQKVNDEPVAEYWLGAHPNASSVIQDGETELVDFIDKAPETCLGSKVYEHFQRLPYLLKVLDVENMLSIQVHPSKPEAEKGFARENALGIPLTASCRNYKDDNHKPEIMVALSDFWLLHGFKSPQKIIETLSKYKELHHLLSIFEKDGYEGLYSKVMLEDDSDTSKTIVPLMQRLEPAFDSGKLSKNQSEYWAVKAYRSFWKDDKVDKGIYSTFLFNVVHLKKGEAIFQDAGVPHAYLEGKNIELMANSDNVLRAGLTPKHMDVPELLKHVAFVETKPNILLGKPVNEQVETIFETPAIDFQLSKIELLDNQRYHSKSNTLEIHFVLNGMARVLSETDLIVQTGDAFFTIAGADYSIEAMQPVTIYKASCPL